MPPQKSQQKSRTVKEEDQDVKKEDTQHGKKESNNKTGVKRKSPPRTEDEKPSSKALKIENSSHENSIIRFLLSSKALSLCQKEDKDSSDSSKNDYFSPDLTPFQHLMCAVILSRPISHNLGLRTIKTVLNEPWNWTNAETVLEAGRENEEGKTERLEAMEQARTQHRQKTASELGGMAQVVKDEGWDEDADGTLGGLLDVVKGERMQEHIRGLLKEKIKGVGNTAVDIFLRRVQACKGWDGIGWFVDWKTEKALQGIGLFVDSKALRTLLENEGGKDTRRNFVVVLERALGIFLEGKQGEVTKLT